MRLRRWWNVDRFIPKKVNLAEMMQNNVDKSTFIEISWCILVNMDSYNYVKMDICWGMNLDDVVNVCAQQPQRWCMYLD